MSQYEIRPPDGQDVYRSIEDQIPTQEGKEAYREALRQAALDLANRIDAVAIKTLDADDSEAK